MNKEQTIKKIQELKKAKKAVILAHCYQNIEIDEVADYIGDSLYLSRKAAETDAEIIVFAGVYFMAETAKILSPEKKVLLPKIDAGCPMADMITPEKLREFKKLYPNAPVVCYVNSTAEIKAESDICCTSANAIKVVNSLESKTVLFIPDRGLGGYVASQLPDKKVISFDGYCPIHMKISAKEIDAQKLLYPDAEVLVHPECSAETIAKADFVGSTTGIIDRVAKSDKKEFIISTETGVIERLKRDFPDKTIILASKSSVCADMKKISLQDILNSLETETPEIFVEKNISEKAFVTINNMLEIKD